MRLFNKALTLTLTALLLLAQGCSKAPAPEEILDAPVQSTPAATATTPQVSFSPAPSLSLPPSPTPQITPSPGVAASPTPAATPYVTPTNTPDDGRVEIAEGFYYQKLDDALKKRITGMSYPANDENCIITYDDLRYIGLQYVDFDGKEHEGELIVHKKLAKEVTQIFRALYLAQYPLTCVRLVDDYGEPGDDNLSMAANNTSAFNYRRVTGSKTLSRHSYGAAIDINPLYNPYIDGGRIAPENGAKYADRSLDFPGKIDHDDLCYKLFIENGWTWGGDWKGDKDYQHFSKDIGY